MNAQENWDCNIFFRVVVVFWFSRPMIARLLKYVMGNIMHANTVSNLVVSCEAEEIKLFLFSSTSTFTLVQKVEASTRWWHHQPNRFEWHRTEDWSHGICKFGWFSRRHWMYLPQPLHSQWVFSCYYIKWFEFYFFFWWKTQFNYISALPDTEVTTVAKLVELCESQVEYISCCPICYENMHINPQRWRSMACDKPHLVNWYLLKLKYSINFFIFCNLFHLLDADIELGSVGKIGS